MQFSSDKFQEFEAQQLNFDSSFRRFRFHSNYVVNRFSTKWLVTPISIYGQIMNLKFLRLFPCTNNT